MAANTFLGCDIKIWMYIVVSVTVFAGSLEVYHTVRNYNKTNKIINKILFIGIPLIFLSAAILGFIATCLDNICLLCPLLTIFTILLPLIIASNVLFYINCMSQSECKGDAMSVATTTAIFIVSIVICISTMLIVYRYYRHIAQ
uniref:Uncharacterized protein n=2 Tax=Wuchereria bancrofti TaxID=6293 RepID=A0AAF5PQI0_WUCBA